MIEQGKLTIKAVKKELRMLQKAEEEQNQGESARSPARTLVAVCWSPKSSGPPKALLHDAPRAHFYLLLSLRLLDRGGTPALAPADNAAAMVEKLNEAHDEALGEIEERESHFAALHGNDGDDEILSSDL